MRRLLTSRLLQSSLLLSVLFHLLMALSFSIAITYQPLFKKKEPDPELYIPAYVDTQLNAVVTPNLTSRSQNYNDTLKTQGEGLFIPSTTLNDYAANQYKMLRTYKMDPVHLIGEQLIDDPLRKLLGIALTAHLIFPKVAMQLHMHGVVSIELLLYPDGRITSIRLLKSSGEKMLDNAALNAVQAMSPVRDVDIYIKEPKPLLFNVIF